MTNSPHLDSKKRTHLKGMLDSPYSNIGSEATRLTPYMFGIGIEPLWTTTNGWTYDGQFFYKSQGVFTPHGMKLRAQGRLNETKVDLSETADL